MDGHLVLLGGEVYELTSPRLHTFADVAAELSDVTGRTISHGLVTVDEYAAGAADHGVPSELVSFLTCLFGEVFGNNAYVIDGVQRALGRSVAPPTDTHPPPGNENVHGHQDRTPRTAAKGGSSMHRQARTWWASSG